MTFLNLLPPGIRERLRLHRERIDSSIYHRVRFAMLSLTLSILLIVAILSFGFMRHLVKLNIQKTIESDAEQASQRLEHVMDSISESMTNLSKNLLITNALVDTTGRDTYIAPFIKSYKLHHDLDVKLTLCDFMGMPIASNVRNPRTFNMPELLKKTIGDGRGYALLESDKSGKSLLMAFPVIWVMTNKPEGILVAEIGINDMFEKTLPVFDELTDRSASLLSRQDTIFKKDRTAGPIFFRVKRPLALRPPLDAMSFQLEIFDHREINLSWLLGIYCVAGTVFIVFALWISRAFSLLLTDRLLVLSTTARRIAQSGSLELAADVKGTDEIKELATAFNAMVGKVREAHVHLERRVEERTGQLFRANEELNCEIREKEKIEQTLRESEQRLSLALTASNDGLWDWDISSNRVYLSPKYYEMTGYGPDEIEPTREPLGSLIHPDDLPKVLNSIEDHQAGRTEQSHVEYRMITKGGPTKWILGRGRVVERDSAGKPLRMTGTIQDITDRKLIEEALKNSEQFTRNILDTVDEGFIVIDPDYRILTANKAYCSQVGGCDEKFVGKHCYEVSHKTTRFCFEEGEECAVRQVFATGRPHSALHRHKDAKDHTLYVETKAFPIKDGTGSVTSVIETINNITERHLLEEERLKTQKLESIGTLAGGIAHDFNNLLQGIFGYISLAKMALARPERLKAMLQQAEEALQLSVNLTTQLLTFSKGGKPVKQKIQIRPIIENAARFALSGSSIDCRLSLADDLYSVEADKGQIGQVIQNIVLNAAQAMPAGGKIEIEARNLQEHKKKQFKIYAEGKYIGISVHDSGPGISEQHLPRIFDPYFTTKEKGSGLGLATSYSIIRNHGGVIHVASPPGEGATFVICLPALEAGMELQEGNPAVSSPGRRARVLLMDDEELVRNIAGEMMHELGHAVEFAENGETAIEMYTASMKAGNPFDIVILDLTIRGGIGGKEVIRRLREVNPGIRAIVSSGYSDDSVVSQCHDNGFKARLSKPYKLEILRDTLNMVLDP